MKVCACVAVPLIRFVAELAGCGPDTVSPNQNYKNSHAKEEVLELHFDMQQIDDWVKRNSFNAILFTAITK